MINTNEIEIATIKNLKAIFFYYIGDNIDKRILGLRIVYDNNKVLDYDYTYKYFNNYVIKVLEVYNKEKNNNIILYNELTEEIINNFDYETLKSININDEFSEYKINLLSIDNFTIRDVEDYIKNIILSVMEIITSNKETTFESIKGNKYKFIAQLTTSKGQKLIPFQCIKKGTNSYTFKIYFSNNYLLKTIEGTIEIFNDRIEIIWNNYDKTLTGQHYYSGNSNTCMEYIKANNGNLLYYNDSFNNITQSEEAVVKKYASLIDIECDKITPTIPNNFIVEQEITEKKDENISYKRKTGYINIQKDYVSIIYFYTEGIIKYNGNLNIPFMNEHTEIRLIPFSIDNEHYILKEITNLPTFKMSGDYKHNVNKYSYSIIRVNQNSDLTLPIDIINEQKINAKEINNLTNVKNYVRKRGK